AEIWSGGAERNGFAAQINRPQIPPGWVSFTSVEWVSFQPVLTRIRLTLAIRIDVPLQRFARTSFLHWL
ncbi:hypothetical protein, partial [Pseudomonas tremae]|uniref:hypothetical protein n=1 Tax=Pseudomonas tremae TaxID=200454 RepID=UPI001F368865